MTADFTNPREENGVSYVLGNLPSACNLKMLLIS